LAESWTTLKIKEHEYTKSKKNIINRSIYFGEFKLAQHEFDKTLFKYGRYYYQNNAILVSNEILIKNIPREFWDAIKKIELRKKNSIPMKVHDKNGFNTDPDIVLNKWKDDFYSLYNPPEEGLHYDEEVYNHFMWMRHEYQINATETNDMVNSDISYDEIEKLVCKVKNKMTMRIDFIPNEVL